MTGRGDPGEGGLSTHRSFPAQASAPTGSNTAGDEVDTELITLDRHPEALGLKIVLDTDPRACGPRHFFLKEAVGNLAGPTQGRLSGLAGGNDKLSLFGQ